MRNKEKKEKALKILNYWKISEMLEQNEFPKISRDKKDSKSVTKRLVQWCDDTNIIDHIEKDDKNDNQLSIKGDTISCCCVKVDKNSIAEYLMSQSGTDSPNKVFTEKIALFAFKVDLNGMYVKNSFRLSPLLWATNEIFDKKTALSPRAYDTQNETIEKLFCAVDDPILESAEFAKIKKDLVSLVPKDCAYEESYYFEYKRYKSENQKNQDDDADDCTQLQMSFFAKDLELFSNILTESNTDSEYQSLIVDYIVSKLEEENTQNKENKVHISPLVKSEETDKSKKDNDLKRLHNLFCECLDVNNAPLGKWPSQYSPSLMQQVAINLAIKEKDGHAPIFSINGPPGTGKTTLLKEIIAHNIVSRAILLSKYEVADDAFEANSFDDGTELNGGYYKFASRFYSFKDDKINQYGILVCSCNNTAVENITKELPAYIEISEKDINKVRKETKDSIYLFNVNDQNKEIYFTNQAKKQKEAFEKGGNEITDNKIPWGVISAPLGRVSNVGTYCINVINSIVKSKEYRGPNNFVNSYLESRKKFLTQLEKVRKMQKEIHDVSLLQIEINNKGIDSYPTEAEVSKAQNDIRELSNKKDVLDQEIALLKAKQTGFISFLKRLFGKNTDLELNEKIRQLNEIMLEVKKSSGVIRLAENVKRIRRLFHKEKENQLINTDFLEGFSRNEKEAHTTNPWFTDEYDAERIKLFFYAVQLHKYFILSSSKIRQNLINFSILQNKYKDDNEDIKKMSSKDKDKSFSTLLQSVFLLTPVISSTFASVGKFLQHIKKPESLGTLIIDEAGQAQPHNAIGALMRCRKAIIVGDPQQIEPVVTISGIYFRIYNDKELDLYKSSKISVQTFADSINPYGAMLDEHTWVGCPLKVHRRCLSPMFDISNELSYGNSMVNQTRNPEDNPKNDIEFIHTESLWVTTNGSEGSGKKNHFVKEEGEVVIKFLKKVQNKDNLFVITPFTSIKEGLQRMVVDILGDDYKGWAKKCIGTVHTFQGKEANEVIFILGCDESSSSGVFDFVNSNIVNVAATRAKFRFYVIGNKDLWANRNSNLNTVAKHITKNINSEDVDDILGITADSPNPLATENTSEKVIENIDKSANTADVINGLDEGKNDEIEHKFPKIEAPICPKCGSTMVKKRNSGTGELFWGCPEYKNGCRYTINIPS